MDARFDESDFDDTHFDETQWADDEPDATERLMGRSWAPEDVVAPEAWTLQDLEDLLPAELD